MLYFAYIIGFFIARILPRRISYFIAEMCACLYYLFSGNDKKALRANMRVILGENVGNRIINEHILSIFRHFAKYLVDFFRFSKLTEKDFDRNIKVEGQEYIREALSKGKGAILVTLHLGNWELGGAIVGALGYPISAIILEQKDARVNDFFIKQRAINGLKSIPIGPGIRDCFKVLKQNKVLAVVGDKDYTNNGIDVDFFGKKAIMPKGTATFALRTGAPIIVCATVRAKDDTFKMRFEKPIEYVPTGDHDKDVREVMGRYLRYYEKIIRETPDQWYAFKEIWKPEQIIR